MEGSTAADNIHLLTKPAVWLLGSRIALFQENWDEVIRLGELFMESNAAVYDLNSVDPELLTNINDSKGFCMMDGLVNPGNCIYIWKFCHTCMISWLLLYLDIIMD